MTVVPELTPEQAGEFANSFAGYESHFVGIIFLDAGVRGTKGPHVVEIVQADPARQITASDFRRFNHLICMDEDHRRQLLDRGAPHAKLRLLLEVDDAASIDEVPDPYYGDMSDYEISLDLIELGTPNLIDSLKRDHL